MIADRVAYIEQTLKDKLNASQVDVTDDSHLHAGHASARGGGHFRVTVVSEKFRDKKTIERHRMVYDAMGNAMKDEIHALSIKAYAPEELN